MVNFKNHLLNVNISKMVGQIFTKIGTFIEKKTDIHAVKLKLRKACLFWKILSVLRGAVFFVDTVYNAGHDN